MNYTPCAINAIAFQRHSDEDSHSGGAAAAAAAQVGSPTRPTRLAISRYVPPLAPTVALL